MEYRHKGHLISYGAWLDPDTKHWEPRLMVFCNEGDHSIEKSILFKVTYPTEKDAQSQALQFAIKWIDDGKPELPAS